MLSYYSDWPVTVEEFGDILMRSTLGERRPVGDGAILKGMLENSNLIVTCRDGGKLVGIARSVTDFHYCCYVSDLAVDKDYQKQGIGKKLIEETTGKVGSSCTVILLSAPTAVDYYPKLGFEKHDRAWVLPPKSPHSGNDQTSS